MHKVSLFLLATMAFSCKKQDSVHPERKNIIETVYASGKILATNEYTLYAQSSGTVTRKLATDGDTVDRGQVLYVIEHDAQSAKLDAAESNFANAQSNSSPGSRILQDLKFQMEAADARYNKDSLEYVRLSNLIAQNIGTQNAVDNAKANYLVSLKQKKSAEERYHATANDLRVNLQNARSQLTGAKTELGNFFIRSESRGTLFQAMKEQGEAVRSGEPVALLGDRMGRVIRLAVDQQDIDRVLKGQEVLLRTDLTGQTIYKAVVDRIYPIMNEVDQTFRVDALFADSTRYPFIHSSVEANIIIRRKNNALVIPRKAMISDDGVEIRENGKTRKVQVKTGIQTLEEVEILDGLNESSTLILPVQK